MKTAFLTAVALFVAPAAAFAADDVPQTTVNIADLDLTTPAGIARLDARVEYAARSMCYSGGRDGQSLRFEAECRKDVIESNRPAVRLAIANATKVRMAAIAGTTPGA